MENGYAGDIYWHLRVIFHFSIGLAVYFDFLFSSAGC